MRRRQALAALGTLSVGSIAGCLDRSSFPFGSDADPHPRRVSLVHLGTLPEDVAFAIDAELPTPTVTDRHPATLVLTARNLGAKRAISVGVDGCRPFNRSRGRSQNGGLWLYGARDEPEPRVDGRWEYDPDGPIGYPAYGCARRVWAAGESQTYVYSVWDDPVTEGYYEPGTYRWTHSVSAAPPESEMDAEPTVQATWGLELRVEEA